MGKKTTVLETYSLILIDILAVVISFLVARGIRYAFGNVASPETEEIIADDMAEPSFSF